MLRVPPEVLDELTAAALVLPFACSNVRWPIDPWVTCTDATPQVGGAARAFAGSELSTALYRLCESSLALGVPQEAVKYAAVLGANYPGSEWYERAYKLVNKRADGVTAS